MNWSGVIFLAAFIPLCCQAAINEHEIERFAFIAASNDGGPGRDKLRYAESDALSLANVFEEIGGLKSQNKVVALSPNKDEFYEAILRFKNKIEKKPKSNQHSQMVFYYSGHSNDQGLLLKDGLITYKDLRFQLESIHADVRMAILDSCQSGAFTRNKGGKRQSAFLVDNSQKVTGNVFLTASSENEAAQESDKIGGSFFTHYLVSALRGAGDISGDKRVTLNEAYYYAFNETLARTESTKEGAQHPAYDIQIAGAGDLVLTDIKQTSATLVVPANITGRLYIRDPSGRLVVELNKIVNNDVSLAVSPGIHSIIVDQSGDLYKQEVRAIDGERTVINPSEFVLLAAERNRSRGDSGFAKAISESLFDLRMSHANTLQAGGYLYYQHINKSWYDVPVEELSDEYRGYAISYQRIVSRNGALRAAFSEAKGFGVVRTASFDYLMSLIGPSFTQKQGVRFYAGLGGYWHRIFGFPRELIDAFQSVDLWSRTYIGGVEMPIGIQWEQGSLLFDLSTILRADSYTGANYFVGSGAKPIYSAQLGFRF